MDDARDLFLSLPAVAQAQLQATVDHKDPDNLRKLTRGVYPYVQTLSDAQGIAELLHSETDPGMRVRRESAQPESTVRIRADVPARGLLTRAAR